MIKYTNILHYGLNVTFMQKKKAHTQKKNNSKNIHIQKTLKVSFRMTKCLNYMQLSADLFGWATCHSK